MLTRSTGDDGIAAVPEHLPVEINAASGHERAMTASELQDIVVATLARRLGGTQRRWRMALGPIKLLDSATYTHCNWSVTLSGTASENHAIESLLDQIRIDHPILAD